MFNESDISYYIDGQPQIWDTLEAKGLFKCNKYKDKILYFNCEWIIIDTNNLSQEIIVTNKLKISVNYLNKKIIFKGYPKSDDLIYNDEPIIQEIGVILFGSNIQNILENYVSSNKISLNNFVLSYNNNEDIFEDKIYLSFKRDSLYFNELFDDNTIKDIKYNYINSIILKGQTVYINTIKGFNVSFVINNIINLELCYLCVIFWISYWDIYHGIKKNFMLNNEEDFNNNTISDILLHNKFMLLYEHYLSKEKIKTLITSNTKLKEIESFLSEQNNELETQKHKLEELLKINTDNIIEKNKIIDNSIKKINLLLEEKNFLLNVLLLEL